MGSVSYNGNPQAYLQVAINNGTITPTANLLSEPPETTPAPLSTIPFPRDGNFVDRKQLLDKIKDRCSLPSTQVALVGFGGVGKSQLAIEYCYRLRERSPETWVFWVNATSKTRFEDSFREIANRAKIPGRDDPKVNIFKLVRLWLLDEKSGKWVIILDGLDDDSYLEKDEEGNDCPWRSLKTYLPITGNGSIIFTTRNNSVARHFVEYNDLISVEAMNDAQALALFESKMKRPTNHEDAKELVELLEHMPLALVQAAAYISRNPLCSERQYIEKFKENDREKKTLLDYEGGNLRQAPEAKKSILITWHISFDHIHRTKPSAARLLSFMSFFDNQGIPQQILRKHSNTKLLIRDFPEAHTSHEFEEAIGTLRDFSFISVVNAAIVDMHGLVQFATRVWLEHHGQLDQQRREFFNALGTEFENDNDHIDGEHLKYRLLSPHVKLALAQRPGDNTSLMLWVEMLRKAVFRALALQNWGDAQKLSTEVVGVLEAIYGRKYNETTISAKQMLASAYLEQGQFSKAEALQNEILNATREALGPKDDATLHCMLHLARVYIYQGAWEDAEILQTQAFNIRNMIPGLEDITTLNIMNGLAETFFHQGRWGDAENLQKKVIKIEKKVLGAQHTLTLLSMGCLAENYMRQGRLLEAETLQKQILDTQKKKSRMENISTFFVTNALVENYVMLGRLAKAKKMGEKVMDDAKKVLGERHPITIKSIINVAAIHKYQKRNEEAIKELARCIKLQLETRFVSGSDIKLLMDVLSIWKSEAADVDEPLS